MKYYEVTSADTGRTFVMSESQCRKQFGKDEWKEIKAGYLPNLIVCETNNSQTGEVKPKEY